MKEKKMKLLHMSLFLITHTSNKHLAVWDRGIRCRVPGKNKMMSMGKYCVGLTCVHKSVCESDKKERDVCRDLLSSEKFELVVHY